MSKGKKIFKKKPIKITFDEKDRETFLRNQGKKHSKKERRKYLNDLKTKKKRTEKIEQNKILKEKIEQRYEELINMKKEINKYANLDDEEEEDE
jgi:hypothetical protein